MSEPFLAEIRLMSFAFAPKGWALCNGQTLPINQNQALFSLLGTTYGGNGQTTFALPNLQARVPIHVGNGHTLGEQAGTDAHTLTAAQLPQHTHVLQASTRAGNTVNPAANVLADTPSQVYAPPANLTPLEPGSVIATGGNQPHTNQQPYLGLSFCIALQGIYPSRN
jgi:microcystin-dependent protein